MARYIPSRFTWPKDHPEYVPAKRTRDPQESAQPKKRNRRSVVTKYNMRNSRTFLRG